MAAAKTPAVKKGEHFDREIVIKVPVGARLRLVVDHPLTKGTVNEICVGRPMGSDHDVITVWARNRKRAKNWCD